MKKRHFLTVAVLGGPGVSLLARAGGKRELLEEHRQYWQNHKPL